MGIFVLFSKNLDYGGSHGSKKQSTINPKTLDVVHKVCCGLDVHKKLLRPA